MGLKLRYNLFYGVTPEDVYKAYSRFYAKRHASLVNTGNDSERYELHELNGSWAILDWNIGWEWKFRREAQLFVSKQLHCFGFLLFVDDGDYWGYEFFNEGIVLDRFVQSTYSWAFPDDPAKGNAELLGSYLNWLSPDEIAPYLVQDPDWESIDQPEEYIDSIDIPPRPGDEYTRFDEMAALNFLRLLGIEVKVVNHYVTLQTPLWKRFWIKYNAIGYLVNKLHRIQT